MQAGQGLTDATAGMRFAVVLCVPRPAGWQAQRFDPGPDNRASVTPVLGITAAQWSEPWRSRYVVERAQTSRKRSHSSRAIFTKAQSLRAAALLNLA